MNYTKASSTPLSHLPTLVVFDCILPIDYFLDKVRETLQVIDEFLHSVPYLHHLSHSAINNFSVHKAD
jgi:phage gp36-like protein